METIICVDTETTGVDPATDAVVEFAAVALVKSFDPPWAWRVDKWETSRINPGRPLTPESQAIHHLRQVDVEGCPNLPEAASAVLAAVTPTNPTSLCFSAHNAAFDGAFLRGTVAGGDERGRMRLCTWRCSMHVWPDAPSHALQVLRYWLPGLDDDVRGMVPPSLAPHRALYDAIAGALLLRRLLREHQPEELLALTQQPALLRRVRFGKHKDAAWPDVPRDYLRWLLRQEGPDRFDEDTRHTAQHWLDRSRC